MPSAGGAEEGTQGAINISITSWVVIAAIRLRLKLVV